MAESSAVRVSKKFNIGCPEEGFLLWAAYEWLSEKGRVFSAFLFWQVLKTELLLCGGEKQQLFS